MKKLAVVRRVAKGARLLDTVKPGWAAEINIEGLNLESPCDCVLGQLYKSYASGISALAINHVPHKYGFTLGGYGNIRQYPAYFAVLKSAWIPEIKKRLAA